MKFKYQLIFFTLINSFILNAQNIHYQGFDYTNDISPPYTLDTLAENSFSPFAYNSNGNQVPYRNFYGSISIDWNSQFLIESTFDDWLITPQITPLSNSSLQFLCVSLGDNSGNYPTSSGMYEIRLSTTDLQRSSFTVLLDSYTLQGANIVEPIIDLSAYDGMPVYIAFVNLSTDIVGLAWDNIEIGTLDGTDAALTIGELDAVYAEDDIHLPYRLQNKYGDDITSFDLNYQVNGGAVVTEAFNGYSIAQFDSVDVDFTAGIEINTGNLNEVKMWVDNLNGGLELYLPNDTLVSTVNVSLLNVNEINLPVSQVYPNPSSGFLKIQSSELFSEIQIIDLTGKVVYQENGLNTKVKSFNFETLNNGIYLVSILHLNGEFEEQKIEILK